MITQEPAPTYWTAIYVYILIVAGIAGCMAAHLVAQNREWHRKQAAAKIAKARRRQDFLVFLRRWRSEIANFQKVLAWPTVPGDASAAVIRSHCASKLKQFYTTFNKVQEDFADDGTGFFHLVHPLFQIGTFDDQELDPKKDPRTAALEGIDGLIKFVEYRQARF
jgi:hypothetical protein